MIEPKHIRLKNLRSTIEAQERNIEALLTGPVEEDDHLKHHNQIQATFIELELEELREQLRRIEDEEV